MAKSKKTDWKEERPVYLWLTIAGALIALVFYIIPKDSRDIEEDTLATAENLILKTDPQLATSGRGGERILLQIKGYDKPFQVAAFDFNEAAKRNILNNIKSGDTINVKIDSSELRSINKETFLNSYTEIHSLTKNGKEYLSIKRANQKAENDLELGVPIGLYLMTTGLIYWSFKTRPRLVPQ